MSRLITHQMSVIALTATRPGLALFRQCGGVAKCGAGATAGHAADRLHVRPGPRICIGKSIRDDLLPIPFNHDIKRQHERSFDLSLDRRR
jgi:hypothetical protein